MTIALAHAQVIAMVKAVTPSNLAGTRGARKFRHTPRPSTDDEKDLPDTGGFWLDVDGALGLRAPPIHQAHPRRVQIEWTLSIAYRAARDGDLLDLAIVADYAAIGLAMASPLNWAQNTTGIVIIGDGGEPLFPGRVESVGGAKILRITIPCEVTV